MNEVKTIPQAQSKNIYNVPKDEIDIATLKISLNPRPLVKDLIKMSRNEQAKWVDYPVEKHIKDEKFMEENFGKEGSKIDKLSSKEANRLNATSIASLAYVAINGQEPFKGKCEAFLKKYFDSRAKNPIIDQKKADKKAERKRKKLVMKVVTKK